MTGTEVEWNTKPLHIAEYATVILASDWLYFSRHGINTCIHLHCTSSLSLPPPPPPLAFQAKLRNIMTMKGSGKLHILGILDQKSGLAFTVCLLRYLGTPRWSVVIFQNFKVTVKRRKVLKFAIIIKAP